MNYPVHYSEWVNLTATVRFHPDTFTGKEKDEETGLSYFGARYYDSDLSGLFLSVDPMADKYPSISPYAYCAWNPVKLVDPDGRDVWTLSDDGTMTWERFSKHDKIMYNGKEITLQNSNNVFGTGHNGYSFSLKDRVFTFTDVMDAQKTFEFFADNLNYEFSALGYREGEKNKYDLTTSLSDVGDENGSARADVLGDKLRKHFHNHPNGIADPSSPKNREGKGDDMTFFANIRQKAKSCEFYIYINDGGGGYRSYFFEGGEANVSDERQSSFMKSSKGYTRKQGAIWNAFSF